ncbi:MAG: UbiA-like polyprenyltransferase [Pirellulaceae bacterium]
MAEQVDSTSMASAMPSLGISQDSSLVRRLLELIRFSHTIFALPFAALACVFALTHPVQPTDITTRTIVWRLLGVLICMVSARSAAMALNRLADARIDAANPRTANRHIPAGLLTVRQVQAFFVVSSAVFISACLLFLPNWLPLVFSVPVLLWLCGYSYAKRFTSAAHLWLGVALALSPACAWVAIRGEVVLQSPVDLLPAWGLAVAITCWVTGFDIIYACQDADFDRGAGLKSIPARLGIAGALRTAAALHAVMLVVLALLPSFFPQLSLGWLYALALVVVGGLVVWQHWLVRPDDLRRVNLAFFQVNATISFGLCLAAAIDAWLR